MPIYPSDRMPDTMNKRVTIGPEHEPLGSTIETLSMEEVVAQEEFNMLETQENPPEPTILQSPNETVEKLKMLISRLAKIDDLINETNI